jgi:hypothetical protein
MTHTRQFAAYTPRIEAIDRRHDHWQARAFAAEPATAMELLAFAAAPPAQ